MSDRQIANLKQELREIDARLANIATMQALLLKARTPPVYDLTEITGLLTLAARRIRGRRS